MHRKRNELLDANGLLLCAFDKLKVEAKVGMSFQYNEDVLRADMLGENAVLKAQNIELEEQVNDLENEQIRLRLALKNQAGSLGQSLLMQSFITIYPIS